MEKTTKEQTIINLRDHDTKSQRDYDVKYQEYYFFCTRHNRPSLHIESFRLFNSLYID